VAHLKEMVDASVSVGIALTIVDKSCGGNKGNQAELASALAHLPARVEYIKVPNIGREATAYLTAIHRMSSTGDIAEHTIFLQEDYPFLDSNVFYVGHPGDTLKSVELIVGHYKASLEKPPYVSRGHAHYIAFQNMGVGSMLGLKNIPEQNRIRSYYSSVARGGKNTTEGEANKCASVLWGFIVAAHSESPSLPASSSGADVPASWRETKSAGCCAYFGTSKASIEAYSTRFWARLLRTAILSANDIDQAANCGKFFALPLQAAEEEPCGSIAKSAPSERLCDGPNLNPWAFEGIWGPLFGDFEGKGILPWSDETECQNDNNGNVRFPCVVPV
jgi:hypothetical protein